VVVCFRPNLNWANDLIVDQKLNQSGGCLRLRSAPRFPVLLEERFKILSAPGRWTLRCDSGFNCDFWAFRGAISSFDIFTKYAIFSKC
jgi:hypothetical protein